MKLYEYSKKVKKFRQNEKELENLRKEYHKRCFELFDEAAGDKEKLKQIAKEEQIGIGTIRKYAWEYATYVLGYSPTEWDNKYISDKKQKLPMNKTKTNLYLLKIKNEESKEKIIKIIEEHGNVEQLKEYIVCFSVVNFPREKDFLIQDLKRKINFYTTKQKELEKIKLDELKKELEKEKEDLELQIYKKNKILIELFIKSNYENKYDFCNSNFIDIKDFENIVEYCKKYDKDTYNQYEAAIVEQNQKEFNKKLSLTKTLIYYLQNGIKNENGVVRPFDIIDYHLYIGLSYELLRTVINAKFLTAPELKTVKPFFEKNKNGFNYRTNELNQILELTTITIISGIKVEQETKELVLDFLKENKVPVNNITYNIALRRYLNNTLQIQEKISVKTKKLREIK